MSIIIGLVCIVLICIVSIQFKTIEETDITAIENMKEDELRTTLSEWKTKYEETYEKYEETITTIDEYNKKIESSEEASELLDKELEKSNLIAGNTDVYGEGIIVTLIDNDEQTIKAEDLLELSVRSFNCLKRAAISTVEDLTNKTEADMEKRLIL